MWQSANWSLTPQCSLCTGKQLYLNIDNNLLHMDAAVLNILELECNVV